METQHIQQLFLEQILALTRDTLAPRRSPLNLKRW
jgi:hypothetical protein